ncbi:MAG: cation diffusion facilitator family transporter [Acidimicrobiia bacterium]
MSRDSHKRRLGIVVVIIAGYAVVEVVAALASGSLSLLSDAGHMGTDALGLAMSLAAMVVATTMARRERQTFGLFRLEILAALANALLLTAIAVYAIVEGILRLERKPEIEAGLMLWVAVGGLVVNVVGVVILRRGAELGLNLEAAYTEVLADLLGSIGVIAAAAIHLTTGWPLADPLVAIAIGLWILPRAGRLGWKALTILTESAPAHVDVEGVRIDLAAVPGVLDVHDLHVWTLTSEMEVATAHLVVAEDIDGHAVLDEASSRMKNGFGIDHATIQVEPESHSECIEQTW